MKVELIGLSQGISFENKQATNYLDFRKDTGELFRLTVPQSVAEELLAIILKDEPKKTAAAPAPEPELDDATTFGGDDTTTGVEPDDDEFVDEDSIPSV